MNILYIAYSCDPYEGSEDRIGWSVPFESAKTNCVYVITKEEQRTSVERFLRENPVKNIKFYFVDIPAFYKEIFKGFMYSGRLNIWNRHAFPLAQSICKEFAINIIHQITPIEFRAIGKYGKISDVKFVCGPLGGGEFIPSGLKYYARGHVLIEMVRSVSNRWYRFKFRVTGKLNQCDYIMFANEETRDFLIKGWEQKLKINNKPITETALDIMEEEEQFDEKKDNKKCVFFAAGRMIYRKGYELLLDALAKVPGELNYTLRIAGNGPELIKLQAICSRNLNLTNHVSFIGGRKYPEIINEYNNADVFVMPSIRETTGTVLLEAISKGVPVITINRFGGAILIDNENGWLYDGSDKEEYIEKLKNAIVECIQNPKEVRRRGKNARKNAEKYTWKSKNKFYQKIYYELLRG